MVIQRRYVKIFRILENDPQGKAIGSFSSDACILRSRASQMQR